MCLLALFAGGAALSSRAAVVGGRQVRTSLITASVAAAADDAALERLWSSAGKPLLRIGKHGAKLSHASGLTDLCENQPFVCVRFTGPRTVESLSELVELVASAELPSGPEGAPVFLASRKPRRGGIEALFAQPARVDDVCSAAFHDALAAAAATKELEAAEWAEERAASAAKAALKATAPSPRRSARPQAPRSAPIVAMAAKGFGSVEELQAAVRDYVAGLPEGQVEGAPRTPTRTPDPGP